MIPLPIDPILPQIVQSLGKACSLVLVAAPGAGKTTRVPPAILKANLLSRDHPNLVMLQPRRVAARASAERIADENHWTLGREVGYHIRFDRKITRDTRLRVVTEGILTRQLVDDPFLEGVGCVILDEFHERSLHADLALALLKEIQQTVREDLLLIVMSATLNAGPISQFLNNCPILQVEGRTFPVDIQHRSTPQALNTRALPNEVACVFADILNTNDDPGHILVFLPGVQEINNTERILAPLANQHNLLILPLHGSLTGEDQIRALRPTTQRKVILATNIAETSLTIEGVRTVIDSGLARIASFDASRALDRLELKRISQASATQRAGRAGRTAPGRCIRLWSTKEHASLSEFELPEIHRIDLTATILAMHAWGHADARKFAWFDPPADHAISAAERLLRLLDCVDADGRITDIGRRVLSFPAHPRLGRILSAPPDGSSPYDRVGIAAILSEKDFILSDRPERGATPKTRGDSDILLRLDLLNECEQRGFPPDIRDHAVDRGAARQIARTRSEFLRLMDRTNDPPTHDTAPLLRLLLAAYPDRVCRHRTNDPAAALMVGGTGVRLSSESIVTDAEFFLALDIRRDERAGKSEAWVRIASRIEPDWLETRTVKEIVYDPARERVVARRAIFYDDLLIRDDREAPVTEEEAGPVLADALRPRAVQLITADESATNILARLNLLRTHMPEHPWPIFDELALQNLVAEAAIGKKSLAEVQRTAWADLLKSHLPYPLDRLLDQHAPTHIDVPSGSRVRLDYSAATGPVLAVRLQEIFGMTQTPRIAAGRVPLLVHLLAPNYRPVQITNDLASFWANTYFQVRKDLRVRYPKHAWPDDPLTAKPEAKGRRRD